MVDLYLLHITVSLPLLLLNRVAEPRRLADAAEHMESFGEGNRSAGTYGVR